MTTLRQLVVTRAGQHRTDNCDLGRFNSSNVRFGNPFAGEVSGTVRQFHEHTLFKKAVAQFSSQKRSHAVCVSHFVDALGGPALFGTDFCVRVAQRAALLHLKPS